MYKKILTGLALASALAFGQELVKNCGFSEPPQNSTIPPAWMASMPDTTIWSYANDDGILVGDALADCVRFANPDGLKGGTLFQKTTCKPNTSYTLRASLKCLGCVPAVKIYDANGSLLVSLHGDAAQPGVWKSKQVTFASGGNKELTISLEGSDLAGVKGESRFDRISILPEQNKTVIAWKQKPFTPAGPNIALHKPYTMKPQPTYSYSHDDGDKTQLTDGVYSNGYFWVQKTTVGWTRNPVHVTIDLGKVEPICGFSWNTAAGVAGVGWPLGLNIFTSLDNKTWYFAGDLCTLGTKNDFPPLEGYAVFKYATNDVRTKGRYVQLIYNGSAYLFGDEFEVFRGPDTLLSQPPAGKHTTDPLSLFWENIFTNTVITRIANDIARFKQASATLPPKLAAEASRKADALLKETYAMGAFDKNTLKTIFPLNDTHAKVLALNSYFMRAKNYNIPFLWRNCRWDNFDITTIPEARPPAPLAIEMMQNEVRAETVNICNPTDKPLSYSVDVSGLPKDANLIICEVLFTDTKDRKAIAAALKPLTTNAYVTVPAGCNRQIWLSFKRPSARAGEYKGRFTAITQGLPTLSLPLTLKIHNIVFPKQPSLHVGGWDYVNGTGGYYNSPGNLKDNLAIMRDIYVDSPWATQAVCPSGAKFNTEGRLINEKQLNFTNWDAWLKRWAGARNYCVFWSVGNTFKGEKMGTARFNIMVGDYVKAWENYINKQGLKSSQLVILLLDEPHDNKEDKIIIAWAKAINAAAPGITLFEDPTYKNPKKGLPEMYALCDILCPNTPMLLANGKQFQDFYLNQQKEGRTLWLYSCSGPAKLLDPITYHRAQKWRAFKMNAKGSFYWALGCGGGTGNSWCAYTQPGTEYSPYFVSKTSTMQGKHSEAIREGVQDYEYLVMLRDKIAQLRKNGRNADADRAQDVLNSAVNTALSNVNSKTLSWASDIDRSLMDRARIAVLQTLDNLH